VSTWIARGFEPSSKWNVRVLKWKGWRNLLTIAALAVCVGAGAFIWMGWWVDAVAVWGLRALWGLLILYFVLVSKW
jgi:hypothetical protein